jgi:hypothetical protein
LECIARDSNQGRCDRRSSSHRERWTATRYDQTPDLTVRIESVHLLTGAGSVFAISAYGTSQDGFDAEWRMIELLMVDGDLVSRIELLDEGDLDIALARSEELSTVR